MALKLTCPSCQNKFGLSEPYPMPGTKVKCDHCAQDIVVSFPDGVMEQLVRRGKRFNHAAPSRTVPRAPSPPPPRSGRPLADAHGSPTELPPTEIPATEIPATEVEKTEVGAYEQGPPTFSEIDRTVPAMSNPYGSPTPMAAAPAASTSGLAAASTVPREVTSVDPDARTERLGEPQARELREPARPSHQARSQRVSEAPPAVDADEEGTISGGNPRQKTPKAKKKGGWLGRAMGCMGSLGMIGLVGIGATAVVGGGAAAAGYYHYSQDLPTVAALQAYQPPTVTLVKDKDGKILGEIYEERRYVVPLEEIPKHVQDAFVSAEDGNFWTHGGIDYLGIARAMYTNVKEGRMAQGASTITQQVTKNFLLSNEKKLERKIKEAILAKRIESTYDKQHILYLYLNQIYLGSKSYGVEAASRTYYGKHVRDISIAEAAILAGLPQRPSDYSPKRNWDKAKERQKYVLGQMLRNGQITQIQHDEALKEEITIVAGNNEFLEQAPHFTEHVRRYLVDKYGEDRVLNEGLVVTTTCDLDLQQTGQKAVYEGVLRVDRKTGWRRAGVVTLKTDAEIKKRRKKQEEAMKKAWVLKKDAAKRIASPKVSKLEKGERYEAVVLEVNKKWARIGVGEHEAILPLAFADWMNEPNPYRYHRRRTLGSLTEVIDVDPSRKKDEQPVLQKGDVVTVVVENLSTKDKQYRNPPKRQKNPFAGTPGENKDYVAVSVWQEPEIESALMSYDIETGAVRAMVGGSDFKKSQFNRTTQSKRQVGSTFKPIVYAAAIDTRKITAASQVTDAPLAFATDQEFIWKPTNYGGDYLGNITLRRALQASKNTCTVRVLEAVDPGMNDDVIYDFARKLGIGGPPSHTLAADHVATPQNDLLCPWVREHKDSTICMDRLPPKDPNISNTRHRRMLKPEDEYWCRACDMSLGLGSASLTMEELVRAYSVFPTHGKLVEPYYIEDVKDRDGNVLERHQKKAHPQVIDEKTAYVARWLVEGVASGGTGYPAKKALKLDSIGGKTGTTNDHKDAWFVGFTPDVVTAAWVGYDEPRRIGSGATGGSTALPIWIDYMKKAAPKSKDRPFLPPPAGVTRAQIDQETGRRVTSGGRSFPFIQGTEPENTGVAKGQVTLDDITDL